MLYVGEGGRLEIKDDDDAEGSDRGGWKDGVIIDGKINKDNVVLVALPQNKTNNQLSRKLLLKLLPLRHFLRR